MSDETQKRDVVDELRLAHDHEKLTKNSTTLFSKAADELERLRGERDEAREAARWWRDTAHGVIQDDSVRPDQRWSWLKGGGA